MDTADNPRIENAGSLGYQDAIEQAIREQSALLNSRCMIFWAVAFALVFLVYLFDLPSRISHLLYSTSVPGTRFFFPAADFSPRMGLIILGVGVWFALYIALTAVLQTAGDDREHWLQSFKDKRFIDPRMLTKVFFPFALVYLLLFALRVDTYIRVTDGGLAVNRPYSLGETSYAWSDVLRITMRRTTGLTSVTSTACSVYLSDGANFTLHGKLPKAANMELAGQHISLQSRVPIYEMSSGTMLVPRVKLTGG